MICHRCKNTDKKYFYNDNGVWYCRKCIKFKRHNIYDRLQATSNKQEACDCVYQLDYELTDLQKQAVLKIRNFLQKKRNVLVYAACGAGKTELVMDSIQTYLRCGKKVGFAISRRQVVLEIRGRLQKAFPKLSVIAVCEGYSSVLDGDIIVCTMHQLYRYHKTFDLLIMDEVDAFPYRGNALLKSIAENSCRGEFLYLTATPDQDTVEAMNQHEIEVVTLFQRPHGYPLIVPQVKCMLQWLQVLYVIQYLKKQKNEGKRVLVFVPTIKLTIRIHCILNLFIRSAMISSKTKNKEEIIEQFHANVYDALVTTTILERGITIRDINIVVMFADHKVFSDASLVQIVGRVGRKKESPFGEGIFLCIKKTKSITRCVDIITEMNRKSIENG